MLTPNTGREEPVDAPDHHARRLWRASLATLARQRLRAPINAAWREWPQVASRRGSSRSRHSRGGSRPREWLTATVHHAHFSSAALADRGTHLGVRYADAIDQLIVPGHILGELE